jgi:uncharacterized membrane protein YraQ (UPF0718 family)
MTQAGLSVEQKGFPYSTALKWAIFIAVAALGLFYVKWNPYFHKAFLAADRHDLGASFLGNAENVLPAPSWGAAWGYALAYFKSVWQAAALGIILGSLIQVLIPRDWLLRVLGQPTVGSSIRGGIASLPGMMCTCCAAPVAVGLRKRGGSVGAVLAFWLGNPLLNPATLIFMFFVLGWKFSLLRFAAGALLVLGVSLLANRLVKTEDIACDALPEVAAAAASPAGAATATTLDAAGKPGALLQRWGKAIWSLFWSIVPAYVIAVLILGAVRAWLFPAISPAIGDSILLLIGLGLAGTLFVIPTAAEISIVKTMMSFGLGIGSAAALLVTLPAVSLPSLIMVRKAFPARVLWFIAGMVALVGVLSGFAATLLLG